MIMLYTDANNCRGLRRDSYPKLVCWAYQQRVRSWAIYCEYLTRSGDRFHNATDRAYLVDHDDPFWHNQGVPGPLGRYPNDLQRELRAASRLRPVAWLDLAYPERSEGLEHPERSEGQESAS